MPPLHLQRVKESCADLLHQELSDPDLYQYVQEKAPTLHELKRRYRAAAREKSPDNDAMVWLYWVAKDGAGSCVGIVEIGIFEDGYAELGFMTFKRFQNLGFATEFCRLAIVAARRRFPRAVLHASVNERNAASKRVVEKLGFRLAKVNHAAELVQGRLTDELVYVLDPGQAVTGSQPEQCP
jgi:[ribosomal protein S5]-alanine N-acetyltransferase